MGGNRALGVPRGSRGVEDRHIVVRIDLDFGQRCADLEDGVQMLSAIGKRSLAANHQGLEFGFRQGTESIIQSLEIADQDPCTRILQAIDQFLDLPPGIHRDRNRPNGGDGRESGNPLGVISHRDGDPVSGPNPVAFDQQCPQGVHVFHGPGEGPMFVLVDEEDFVSPAACGVEERTQGGRGGLENLEFLPTDGAVGDGKGPPGARQGGDGFLVADAHWTGSSLRCWIDKPTL